MAKDGEEHFIAKIAQKVIIEKDGKVLLVRHPKNEKWEIPGGRLNKGELPQDGLKREVREELGADIKLMNIIHANIFVHETEGDHLTLYYVAELTDPSQAFSLEEAEVAEVAWITADELDTRPLWEDIREALVLFFKLSDK